MKKLNSTLIFLIGISALIFIYQYQTYKSYIKVTAKVTKLTKHETTSSNSRNSYTYNKPIIEFTTNEGETVTYVPFINYRDDWKKGEKITLLYDPRNPQTNLVIDLFFLKYPIICLIIFLYLTYYIFIKLPMKSNAKRQARKDAFWAKKNAEKEKQT